MFALVPGFFIAISLICAIGAQNAFIIRQSLTRQHVLMMVLIGFASDTAMILLGIGGLGALIESQPWLLEFIRWFGAAYLTWFGISSLRAAFKGQSLDASGGKLLSKKQVALSLLGFNFLNPHFYLDTVILIGSIGNTFGQNRWFFAVGASVASLVWFASIAYGARAASRFMSRPIVWRILDAVIAAIMFALAVGLVFYRFA